MREGLEQWDYVVAALSIGVVGTLLLVGWALATMIRAERRRDKVRGK
jgi:O-antigen ligase